MFYVRHHDDQLTMFNAKCQNVVLMNHIRKVLNVAASIDLVAQAPDYKNVQPLALADRGDATYGHTFLAPRAIYVLLTVVEDEDGVKDFTVAWKSKTSDEADKIAAALELKTADERKKAGAKGGKGKK
jgi:hypothetical protein